ncbi:vesicle-associated membrane protein-associated protein B-like [Drosophila pseudoobscura]|uniref:Vesicle-associated membrane protein-associated protein B-like n=1 Tax=Drosophila pseudoobscura pseudoobscura TaxID=46245 RepID=A0A6I8VA96_DROPS|nr:vesicle-associated membrane protein-associated protein B [Drosophila pseudoobscura]XP_033235713.1 vesicle-associated membrane protein-associated protein B [Drosophila pseudoobscura]
MSKPTDEPPLIIDPEHELFFAGPFNQPIVTILTLRNSSEAPLAFKIKTTAPRRYFVRPSVGLIPPLRSIHVGICLQPLNHDQQQKTDTFLVRSVHAPTNADLSDLNGLWKELELEPQQLWDAKLKCVFEKSRCISVGGAATIVRPVNAETKEALLETNIELRTENLHLKILLENYRNSLILKTPSEDYVPVPAEKKRPFLYIVIFFVSAILGFFLSTYLP